MQRQLQNKMVQSIGYLAPEFPGQTHLFLWREIEALAELGIGCELISTQRPPQAIVVHSWAEAAQANTTYLVPFGLEDGIGAIAEVLRAGPRRWWTCLMIALQAPGATGSDRLRLLALVLPAAKLACIARKKGLTHVHVPSCANAANIAMFASVLSGLKYSLSLLGPTLEGYGPNQENKWRHAAFVLVMSQLLYRVASERLRGFLPKRVEVAPVGVDLDAMKRGDRYVPWSAGSVCRIYSCGRLNRIKGHLGLIEAVALLRERGIDARLSIAGEDEQGGRGYRRELEQQIRDRAAGEFVTLLGAVAEGTHRDCIADAHLFALASLNEGISVAIMEAMAMETPVVVTDVGGNAELIDTGLDGLLVQPGDPMVFADAMEMVLRDPDLALRLSAQSREKVRRKFDSRIGAQTLVRCLEESQRAP